jgi:hypothetical protein
MGNDVWGNDKPRKLVKKVWADLARFQKMAAVAGEVHRVFVGSMMDIFEKSMPLIDGKGNEIIGKLEDDYPGALYTGDLRQQLFNNITVGLYPNLMFLLLTKRPSNINKHIPESWNDNPPENVMFGISLSCEKNVKDLFPHFIKVKGRKFLSVEPQIESIDLAEPNDKYGYPIHHIDWVIQGGESGHHKRPFDIKWAYEMKEVCETAKCLSFSNR